MSQLREIYDHPRIQAINQELFELQTKVEQLCAEASAIATELTGEQWDVGVNRAKQLMILHHYEDEES